MARYTVVLIDRPAWYVPVIEQEVLAEVDARAIVGWARLSASPAPDPPPEGAGLAPAALSRASVAYVASARHTEDVFAAMAGDAEAILVGAAKVTASVLDRLPRLRVIGRPGIGHDAVDVEAATRRGIAVFSAPGFCVAEVADHTLMFALALARKLPAMHHAMRRGVWARALTSPMPPVGEMTLGLVAFGEIPRAVADRARPFGFRVIACDPRVPQAEAERHGVTMMSLDEVLVRSDILSVHAPLSRETYHLIGERELGLMKPTSCLINTARGPVVDSRALIAALQSGRVAGAALDVFEPEPLRSDSPLLCMDNVLLTPHIAGVSDGAQIAVKRRTCQHIARALVGEWPATRDLVNPEALSRRRRAP